MRAMLLILFPPRDIISGCWYARGYKMISRMARADMLDGEPAVSILKSPTLRLPPLPPMSPLPTTACLNGV